MSPTPRFLSAVLGALTLAGCGPARPNSEPPPAPTPAPAPPPAPLPRPNIDPAPTPRRPVEVTTRDAAPGAPDSAPADTLRPIAPPEAAYRSGWMPRSSTGVDSFLAEHPTLDGRGTLIAILDTGIDPGIPGLGATSTGAPKILDLRDFSGEGDVPLVRVRPSDGAASFAGRRLVGLGGSGDPGGREPYYAGALPEMVLGQPPAADLNGNGRVGDTLVVVVTRAKGEWVAIPDTDSDGSLVGERPVRDYLAARETFGWGTAGRPAPATLAVNLREVGGEPRLTLVFELTGHGSHVAGIAAGHDIYGVRGFDGIAPGAQLLGLKIANSAQGDVSTTGSMARAIDYAIAFAAERRLPLVINLSFGVGNEREGAARIDAIIDSVLGGRAQPVFTVAAGNDGPGLSTVGFPGSAERAISVGGTLPAAFLPRRPGADPPADQVAYFSSRGGELAKPDLVAPAAAYSTKPRWDVGEEVEQGTSMAAPHVAGLSALLLSALAAEGATVDGAAIKQALVASSRPLRAAGYLDEGAGLPNVARAYEWLRGAARQPDLRVRVAGRPGHTAAWQVRAPGTLDTAVTFLLIRPPGRPATFTLRSSAAWLAVPPRVTLRGPRERIVVRYRGPGLRAPGVHTGVVTGWGADPTAGPAFRLVNTVVVPYRPGRDTAVTAQVEPGGTFRGFVPAEGGRPFEVSVAAAAGEQGLAFLHEPGGQPFRDESARAAGPGDEAAVYRVDARDVVPGAYQVAVAGPPLRGLAATVRVTHAPLRLRVEPTRGGLLARVTNRTRAPVAAALEALLGGAERSDSVVGSGGDLRRIDFIAPAWAKGVVVDVTMDRAQWDRFTDFGVTLFDSAGRQLEKSPLNYAFGRLEATLPDGHAGLPLEVRLFPGLADSTAAGEWAARVTIRLYADTTASLAAAPGQAAEVRLGPGASASAAFAIRDNPWPAGPGFAPLAVLVARVGDRTWTREAATLGVPGAAP